MCSSRGDVLTVVDRMEEMIGSYPPRKEPYEKHFAPNEAPSGLLARTGTNSVRTRYVARVK